MGTTKVTDSAPPSGIVEAEAVQQSGQVVQRVAVEEKHEITPDGKEAEKSDNKTKKKKPEASLANYFVSYSCIQCYSY